MGLNKRLIDQAGGAAGVTNTDNFDVVTYTGNGTTQSITSLDFQPDLIWVKNRDDADQAHVLQDTVRGSGQSKTLASNNTSYEGQFGAYGYISSFDTNGFTVVDGLGNHTNTNGKGYVAWCFKGGGSAVTNTDGSITSQVSANQDAGFSIVKYVGTQTSGPTVGHGLSSAPEMIIAKSLDITEGWRFGSDYIGWTHYMNLNNNSQAYPASTIWNDTAPTNSVFTLGNNNAANGSGNDHIAYCFHSVDGYQKVGYYTSNASVKITTGFEPRWIMQKYTGVSSEWWIMDTARYDGSIGTHGGKLVKPYLEANTSDAEGSVPPGSVEFVSDGFYPTNFFNSNGVIYLAIA